MSVTAITEKEPPRLADTTTGGKTVTRTLQALSDSKNDGPATVQAHASCPVKGSTYSYGSESDATLICTGVSIEPVPGDDGYPFSKVWKIDATYSNQVDTASLGDDEDNPLDDPPTWEVDWVPYQVPATLDRDGNVVKTTAEELFDPPHMIEVFNPILIVTRNEPSTSLAYVDDWMNTTNSDAFFGAEPRTLRLRLRARNAVRGQYEYVVMTYEFEKKASLLAPVNRVWNPTPILNMGFRYRVQANGATQEFIDPNTKMPPSTPIMLNLDGTRIEDGAQPYLLEFNFLREKAFSSLGITF